MSTYYVILVQKQEIKANRILLNYRSDSNVTGFPTSLLYLNFSYLKTHTHTHIKSTCWRILWALASFPHMWIFLMCHSGSSILERVIPGNLNSSPWITLLIIYHLFLLEQCPLIYVHDHLVLVLQCFLGSCDLTGLVCLCFGFIICLMGSMSVIREKQGNIFLATYFWVMGTSPFGTPGFIVLTGSVSQEVRHDRVGWFIFISVVSGGLGGNNWKHSADSLSIFHIFYILVGSGTCLQTNTCLVLQCQGHWPCSLVNEYVQASVIRALNRSPWLFWHGPRIHQAHSHRIFFSTDIQGSLDLRTLPFHKVWQDHTVEEFRVET